MMKKSSMFLTMILAALCLFAGAAYGNGCLPADNLWIRAVIQTQEKGDVDALWEKGGEGETAAGDRVIWGYFYASPADVSWGSRQNPDLFVKIWIDHGGRVDVNFFHVSVPDIKVWSDYPCNDSPDEYSVTTTSKRYIRHYYENGQSDTEEKTEDGNPPEGYTPSDRPAGYSLDNDLKIGAVINTEEKGAIQALWQAGGQAITTRGDEVIWGYFYADDSLVTWGNKQNPDLFVKIWFDVSGRVDVNFFHVSVPDIEVYSDLPDQGNYEQKGTTILDNRYIRHEYDVFQILMDNVTAENAEIRNAVMLIESPYFTWQGASGMADPANGVAMLPEDQFRSASLGKTMCATLVMKLSEAGKIDVNAPIRQYLSDEVMKGLHEYEGKSYGDEILVRHLLNHTSGLPDYFFDGDTDENGYSEFLNLMLENPDKLWTPEETIEYAKSRLTPLFPPGEGFHYADTNYQLLGLIIESVSGNALHEVYRELLFDPLGMTHTYMIFREPALPVIAGRGISHVYMGQLDYTSFQMLSAEWGGGGLVTTAQDLNRFIRAFAKNEIFADPAAREKMFEWRAVGEGEYYGFGVERYVFGEFGIPQLAGLGEIWGHSGFSNSFMYYWPERDISFCGTLNQSVISDSVGADWFIRLVYPLMLKISENDARTWTEAFDDLHEKISAEYAFTEWKGIDWKALYETFQPRMVSSQETGDIAAYYLALREYVYSIPDGHVSLQNASETAAETASQAVAAHIGGSYGLALIGLDDGRILAHILPAEGPAAKAGIRFGAEITEWDGLPIRAALNRVSVIWSGGASHATNEIRRLEQYRFIGRAPVGSQAKVTFKNPGESETTVTLTAVNDDYKTYILSNYFPTDTDTKTPLQYKTLPSGYGYIKITCEPGAGDADYEEFVRLYKTAMKTFTDKGVPGIILDLRRNNGGSEDTAAWMAGFFYSEKTHYQSINLYNSESGKFEVSEHIDIEPQSSYYGGQVVVMVGPGCLSSGEGFAMAIQKLPNARVISFYASNGSFGISNAAVNMPGGFIVNFPKGQSLDEKGLIQIDGDKTGNGGVMPDVRVPLTEATVRAVYAEGKDPELDFAVETLTGARSN